MIVERPWVLTALTAESVETVRRWRNQTDPAVFRTPYPLTAPMQQEFFTTVVSARTSPHRYWAVRAAPDGVPETLVAMVGLTNLDWENGHAEISLIVDPAMRGRGVGCSAVALVLGQAFDAMRLQTVFGECYHCNPALRFWKQRVAEYAGDGVTLPGRKMARGRLWASYYFWFPTWSGTIPPGSA